MFEKWFSRHRNQTSLRLHAVGIPLVILAIPCVVLGIHTAAVWWYVPATALFILGYALQFIGHAIEGNDAGELILVKKMLHLPYRAVADEPRKEVDMDARGEHALDVIRNRHSSRKYNSQPVDKASLETLVDAGRLAASGRNVQPWHFVVVTDKAVLAKLASIATNGKFLVDAAACIAVVSDDSKYYLEDGSAATQNIMLAAEALGLGTCWIAGDKKPYVQDVLKTIAAPADKKLVSMIAVGHSADTPSRATKRTLADVLHWETF